jgi:hypothetical protein
MSLLGAWFLATLPTALAVPDACDAFGPVTERQDDPAADARILGDVRLGALGRALAIGDFDGDGIDDLAVGAPGEAGQGSATGAVHLFYGPITDVGDLAPTDADATLVPATPRLRAGWALANVGDLDGDGRDDLLVGSDPASGSVAPEGIAWLVGGDNYALTQDLDAVALATFTGELPGDRFGSTVSAAGDLDDDGFPDLVIAAPESDRTATDAGAAYVFYGPLAGSELAANADVTIVGASVNARLGRSMAALGDFDGDGRDDLVLGAPRDRTLANNAGAAFVVSGDPLLGGEFDLSLATTTLRGAQADRAGWSVAASGDGGLWIGSRLYGGVRRGAVHKVDNGTVGGFFIEDIALARRTGARAAHLFGSAVAVGDFDADGTPDIAVGAEDASTAGLTEVGAAWTLLGSFEDTVRVSDDSGAHYGTLRSGDYGSALAVGDLNDDGFDDLVVGGWRARTAGRSTSGTVGVFLGGHDLVDEAPWYADTDGDGFGDPATEEIACVAPTPQHVLRGGDCNDASTAVFPYAPELSCGDPTDYNCDGVVGPVDTDGDGVNACAGDCDDTTAAVVPGADELCGDDVDNDCDGAIDDGNAVDARTWNPDADGDGFGNRALFLRACEDPEIFVGGSVDVGGDCNDLNVAINPAAAEFCDLVDNDCDDAVDEGDAIDAVRWYADADGDGFGDLGASLLACQAPPAHTRDARDCDDTSSAVRPGAVETCNFVDDDCNGADYLGGISDLTDPWLRLSGERSGAQLGSALAFVPDMNGDGMDEILAGAPRSSLGGNEAGTVYLRFGRPDGADHDLAEVLADGSRRYDARIVCERVGSRCGAALTAGDFDGDGIGDIAIGAEGMARPGLGQGAVFVWYGPVSGELDPEAADAVFSGEVGGDNAGGALDAADLDGDGADDLLIGAAIADAGGTRRGRAYLMYGGARWTDLRLDAADAHLDGELDREGLGNAVAFAGDLDGDGFGDLAVGAPTSGALERGRVLVVAGTGTRHAGAMTPSAAWSADDTAQRAGSDLAGLGDVDGDGRDDLAVGSRRNDAWIVYGAGFADSTFDDLRVTQIAGRVGEFIGQRVSGAGDVNGDGFADFVFGGAASDDNGIDAGAAYLLYGGDALPAYIEGTSLESFGRLEGDTFPTFSVANNGGVEGAQLRGTETGGKLGLDVAGGGDLDGDGYPDLLLGAVEGGGGRGQVHGVLAGPYGTDTVGAGDPWSETWAVDGDDADWLPSERVTSTGNAVALTWDAANLYLGSQGPEVSAGTASHVFVAYFGTGAGTTTGLAFNNQQPTLPFSAGHALVWRANDSQSSLYSWNGSSWQLGSLAAAGGTHLEDNAAGTVEFAVPRAVVAGSSVQLVAW